MSATATKPRAKPARPYSRETAAEALLPILKNEPQSEAALARALDLPGNRAQSTVVHDGLAVLEARHQAKKVPWRGKMGWVTYESEHEAVLPTPTAIVFPPVQMVRCDEIFVPPYQRPLTSYYSEIMKDFSIYLFGNIVLSDRGANTGEKRYAAVDGQTRWKAASDLGVVEVPGIIHTGLAPHAEARLFVDIQRKRKAVTSYFAFRAELFAERMEVDMGLEPSGDAIAIVELVEATGWKIGDGTEDIKSPGALRTCYRKDEYLLERTLVNLKAAWPQQPPEAALIKGLHYLFRNYPLGDRRTKDQIDDTRLVKKLQVAGLRKVRLKADAAREMGNKTTEKAFAMGIQSIYQGS